MDQQAQRLPFHKIEDFREARKGWKQAHEVVAERCNYIIRKIAETCEFKLTTWWFPNAAEDYELGEADIELPYLQYRTDPEREDSPQTTIIDLFGGELYLHQFFPTRWLWEDFEEELINGRKSYQDHRQKIAEKLDEEVKYKKEIKERELLAKLKAKYEGPTN